MTCQHMKFQASVNVGRITKTDGGPVVGYAAEVRILCAECGLSFEFRGLPVGVLADGAAMSVDGQEARLAIVPHGTEATPADLISYTIRGRQS